MSDGEFDTKEGNDMRLLNREEIKKVFTIHDAITCGKIAFKMISEGSCEIPLRTNIQVPRYQGSMLFMPAYAQELDAAALKIINIFPQNIDKGLPSAPAQLLLIDGKTGIVSAILDGTYVTQLRTGAASGAAFSLLAKKDCRRGAIIGTGGQAPSQLEAMLAVRPLEEVRVFDLNFDRAQAFADRMREELSQYGANIIAVPTADEVICDADLIVTLTPSSTPVFNGAKVKPGATISCVGSYQPHMQEVDPVLLQRASKIYFDSRSAVLAEAGDIIIPLQEGLITEAAFTGELGQVVLGNLTGRENDEEIIVFETVGVAIQDLVAAKCILDKAVAANGGVLWQ